MCKEPYLTNACELSSRTVIVTFSDKARVYMPVEDWYRKKGRGER